MDYETSDLLIRHPKADSGSLQQKHFFGKWAQFFREEHHNFPALKHYTETHPLYLRDRDYKRLVRLPKK